MNSIIKRAEYRLITLPSDPEFDGIEIGFNTGSTGEFGIFVNDHGEKRIIILADYDGFISELSSLTSWTEESLRKSLDGKV